MCVLCEGTVTEISAKEAELFVRDRHNSRIIRGYGAKPFPGQATPLQRRVRGLMML